MKFELSKTKHDEFPMGGWWEKNGFNKGLIRAYLGSEHTKKHDIEYRREDVSLCADLKEDGYYWRITFKNKKFTEEQYRALEKLLENGS